MFKDITIKGLALAVLFLTGVESMLAQPFWSEDFADQATATTNWVNGGTNPGAEDWTWTTNPTAGYQGGVPGFSAPTVANGYFYFNSDANGENNPHDVTLTGTGVPVDCSGKTNVELSFFSQYAKFNASATAYVGVSTDGINFTYKEVLGQVPADNLFEGEVTVALPEADNQPQVWIQFRWVGDWEYHWKVDDLELSASVGPIPCDQNPDAIICDNFEDYNLGNISPQSPWWLPWSLNENGADNAVVSTEQASQGTKSMKVVQNDDQLLLLGNKTAGRYSLKWKMYVPTGNAAYINVQTDQNNPGASNANFSAQIYFNANGTTTFDIPTPALEGAYPQGEWFNLEFTFDLDNNLCKVFLNGALLRAFAYPQALGAIDFYGADATYIFYVDEVEYVELPAIVYNADNCASAVDLTQYFGQQPDLPQTTGLFDNTNASVDPSDPFINCWAENVSGATDVVNGSMWYTFTGDGGSYHIETVPCNATNYIGSAQNLPGDTQMAIFTGECGDYTLVECNDDLDITGNPDFRAGIDFQTTSGTTYYILIDGFQGDNGIVATGEFCIEITQEAAVNCSNAQAGTYSSGTGFLCFGRNINTLITLDDPDQWLIPQNGPVNGMAWVITTVPVPANTWPPSLGASYLGATNGYLQTPFVLGLNNTGGFPAGVYYFTPILVGGGIDLNPNNAVVNVTETDISQGCFFLGESQAVTILPFLDEIQAVGLPTNETVPPGNNGAIELIVEGGLPGYVQDPGLYIITWSNGATGFNLTGLAGGDYEVTISDPSGCVDDFVTTVTVGTTVGTNDPASVKQLSVNPNPAVDQVVLKLELESAADVRIELVNTLGQTMQTINSGKVSGLNQTVLLNNCATGTYFLRVVIDGETAVRRIQVQR